MLRRVVLALLAVTVLVLLADLAGGPTGPVRSAGSTVVGPLLRAASPDEVDQGESELIRLRARVAELEDQVEVAKGESSLATLAGEHELEVLPARVVGVGTPDARGTVRLTLDVGTEDGVRADSAVVDGDGLVGRVVSVGRWTSDVELLGAAGTSVGVRVGEPGVLGRLSASDPLLEQSSGELAVTTLQEGRIEGGAAVVTLGSEGGVPYPPGLPVGTVGEVADAPGRLTASATVLPTADLASVHVVGVVLSGPDR